MAVATGANGPDGDGTAVDGDGAAADDHTPASRPLSAGTRRTLRIPVGWLAWLPVLACTVAFAAGLDLPPAWRYGPLAASVVLFGLPHGAVDWSALPRARTGRLDGRWMAAVGVTYLFLGGAYALAWFLAPVAAAVAFVGLTWLHWGQGELHPLTAVFGADHLGAAWRRWLTVLVRGGLPMLVPLLAFPDRYRTVVDAFAAPFGGAVPAWPFTAEVRLGLGGAFAALTALRLAAGYRATRNRRAWGIDAAETLLLWAFFLAVPPVFAVGVYFCVWHSPRHVARVLTFDSRARSALAGGRLGRPLWRFAREAAVPTAVALFGTGALWLAAPDPEPTVEGAAALYLVAIAVLTLPHVVVVTWLDRTQGLL